MSKTNQGDNNMAAELTYGMKAVGLTFNPSGDERVRYIKQQFADIIDELQAMRTATDTSKPDAEVARMASIAITEAQTAQMWAVKALTWS
jgi:hypothetical protein